MSTNERKINGMLLLIEVSNNTSDAGTQKMVDRLFEGFRSNTTLSPLFEEALKRRPLKNE